MPPTIIITRPKAQAERFANDLQDAYGADLPILIAPLMRIDPVDPSGSLGSPDHVIFTSANAVAQVDRLGITRDGASANRRVKPQKRLASRLRFRTVMRRR